MILPGNNQVGELPHRPHVEVAARGGWGAEAGRRMETPLLTPGLQTSFLPSSLAVRWSRQGQVGNQAAKPSILYLKGKTNTYQHGLRKLIIRKGKIMKYTALAF